MSKTPPPPEQTGPDPDAIARVIVLVYGLLDGTRPFWCYVAVKPSQYKPFLEAQTAGTLNLHNFTPFGEIIISGEGSQPPEEVTIKVAEVYQTDAKQFFQPIDPEAEVAKKVQEHEKKKAE